MSPYDSGWGPPRGAGRPARSYDAAWRGPLPGPRGPRGGDFRPPHAWGGGGVDRERMDEDFGWGADDVWGGNGPGTAEMAGEAPLHGPARYGLGPYHGRLLRRRRPDEELKEEVEEALFYDTWVDAEAISVKVDDGVVTLSGELPDYQEIRYATDDAWDVDGVRGVRSELRVRGAGQGQDEG